MKGFRIMTLLAFNMWWDMPPDLSVAHAILVCGRLITIGLFAHALISSKW